MRIGLFGGSFNPVHLGHLRAAEEDREGMALDLVYFVPAASPPHKPIAGIAPAEHRLQMVRLATKGNRHFMVSDVEIRRGGSSFTIDTVRHFLLTMRPPAELYLILGTDQFEEFDTWKEANELVRLSHVVVHTRPGTEQVSASDRSIAVLGRFGYSKDSNWYVNPSGKTVTFLATTFFPISASLIRRKIAAHESIRYLVPGDVADYIERHGIYC